MGTEQEFQWLFGIKK